MRDKSAFIIGYTGEVGKQLTKLLLSTNLYNTITLIGRRKVDYLDDYCINTANQVVVDFHQLKEKHADQFVGFDVGFICLGTTNHISESKDTFAQVEYDYPVTIAKLARQYGTQQLHLISAVGAHPASRFAYLKIKGETEQAIASLGFPKFCAYRPRVILCKRKGAPLAERVGMQLLFKPISRIFPTRFTVPAISIAKAMIYSSFIETSPYEQVENITLHARANAFDQWRQAR